MDITLLLLFIPTFAAISITPGMCMTLSMSLGISHGVRRTLWMMLGELTGVALVAIAAVAGVATVMLNYPVVFRVFCYLGGAYLVYLGWKQWRTEPSVLPDGSVQDTNASDKLALVIQGFVTAVSNPKGWAFMIAFLPPFISDQHPVLTQMIGLLLVITVIEFISLMIYASGGRQLAIWLQSGQRLHWINRISGSMMIIIGIWLALSH